MTHKIIHHSSKFLTANLLHSCAVAFCLVLASCAGTRSQPAPVIDRTELPSDNSQESASTSKSGADNPSTSKKPLPGNQYEVVKGDTLYSIGKKLGIPYQKIAEANNIENNAIHVGQVLNLPGANKPSNKSDNAESGVVTQPLKTVDSPKAEQKPTMVDGVPHYDYPKATRDIASANAKPVIANGASKPSTTETKPATNKTDSAKPPSNETSNSGSVDIDTLQDQNIEWRWPAKGKLIAEYDKRINKGIDIAGNVGQPILAASAGKVIYSGTDIRGYGKLVIIKHNRNYLSVYAHQGNIFVKEGQFVNLNDKISEMGRDNTSTTKLHFEIRKKGKTVDPKEYLPT